MTELSRTERDELSEVAEWIASGASVWWFVFAVINLYWASGGTVGVWTLWPGEAAIAGDREPWITTVLWVFGGFNLVLAVLALALTRPWGRCVPTGVLSASAWLIGVTLVPFVAVDTLLSGLVTVDVLDTDGVDRVTLAWRLLFWNLWWIVGVVLYCGAVWLDQYSDDQLPAAADAES